MAGSISYWPLPGSGSGGASIESKAPSNTMPEGVTTLAPAWALARSGSLTSSPISLCNAPTTNSRIDIVLPCAKNGLTRRSGSTPCTFDVSTVPEGVAVMVP